MNFLITSGSRFLLFALLPAVFLCTGCEEAPKIREDQAEIKGKLSIDGTPLRGGGIRFVLESDPILQSRSIIREDGTYNCPNAPIGKVLVTIETKSVTFGGPKDSYVPIPDRYTILETSGLSTEVKAGTNDYDVDLEP